MKTIDLHGVRHEDVEDKLIEFFAFTDPPFRVITGHSEFMQEVARKIVNTFEYSCHGESDYNLGSLIVTENKWWKG